MRDRKFVAFDWDRHWMRAFAIAAAGSSGSFDLFPPVLGYRTYGKSKTSYLVSLERQQSDWSKKVFFRDNHTCQICGGTEQLEAHHQWPQSSFVAFRYLIRNGVTLCRGCHENAYSFRSFTPAQFNWLVQDCEAVNENILRDDFWEQYGSYLSLGWLHLFEIEPEGVVWDSPEVQESLEHFAAFAQMNQLVERTIEAASHATSPAKAFALNKRFASKIAPQVPEERLSFCTSDPMQLSFWN